MNYNINSDGHSHRTAARQDAVVDELRRRITSGRYKPGARLPTRLEFGRELQVSSVTTQRALDTLVSQGFVKVRGRRSGTFVAERPPHLHEYALVSPYTAASPSWSKYWVALAGAAAEQERLRGIRIRIYQGIEVHDDNLGYQELLQAVSRQALAGVIFAGELNLDGSPFSARWNYPGVALADDPSHGRLPLVRLDWDQFTRRMLEHLAAAGRKRVAVLSVPSHRAQMAAVPGIAAALGLEIQPQWLHLVHHLAADSAASLTHLLFHPNQAKRPDGLAVMDDNLMEHVSRGLSAAGAAVPGDVHVVGHCNFPWPPACSVPTTWMGFDARRILAACLDAIDTQRAGRKPAPLTVIPAVFESELRTNSAAPIAAS